MPMPTSRGEIWLVLGDDGRAVEETHHPGHGKEDVCVIELVLWPNEEQLKTGEHTVFAIKEHHTLADVIKRYDEESTGNDVLVIIPHDKHEVDSAIVPRRLFHEMARASGAKLRSDMAKYIR